MWPTQILTNVAYIEVYSVHWKKNQLLTCFLTKFSKLLRELVSELPDVSKNTKSATFADFGDFRAAREFEIKNKIRVNISVP